MSPAVTPFVVAAEVRLVPVKAAVFMQRAVLAGSVEIGRLRLMARTGTPVLAIQAPAAAAAIPARRRRKPEGLAAFRVAAVEAVEQ